MSDLSVWPLTIDEAVERLMSNLSIEEKRNIRDAPADDEILFQFGLGLFIRDEYGLNSGNEALLAVCARAKYSNPPPYLYDSDSASVVIIKALIRRLRKETSGS